MPPPPFPKGSIRMAVHHRWTPPLPPDQGDHRGKKRSLRLVGPFLVHKLFQTPPPPPSSSNTSLPPPFPTPSTTPHAAVRAPVGHATASGGQAQRLVRHILRLEACPGAPYTGHNAVLARGVPPSCVPFAPAPSPPPPPPPWRCCRVVRLLKMEHYFESVTLIDNIVLRAKHVLVARCCPVLCPPPAPPSALQT